MKTYILLLLALCPFVFFGQEIANYLLDIVPPSPMAHELTRFEIQQPNLYTGTAQINT